MSGSERSIGFSDPWCSIRWTAPFFVRVERSLIIHLQAVRKVIAQDRDEVSVEVEGFKELLMLGRRGSFRLRRALRESNALR